MKRIGWVLVLLVSACVEEETSTEDECRLSSNCEQYGECGVWKGKCAPTSVNDCLGSMSCYAPETDWGMTAGSCCYNAELHICDTSCTIACAMSAECTIFQERHCFWCEMLHACMSYENLPQECQ